MDFAPSRRSLGALTLTVLFSMLIAALLLARPAAAAERLFWGNYRDHPGSIGFSDIDGSAGGALAHPGTELNDVEGLAYDSATGRIYAASEAKTAGGAIVWIAIDGSAGGVFTPAGAPVEEPEGIAINPATRTVYWVNTDGSEPTSGSIAFANLDTGVGGLLNTTGATLLEPWRLAIDPASGRVFWTNYPSGKEAYVSFANLDNSGGGGDLDMSGLASADSNSLAVDSVAGRLYLLRNNGIASLNVLGGGGAELDPAAAGAVLDEPYGLSVDPVLGRFLWGNWGVEAGQPNGIGTSNTSTTVGGAISPVGAPVNGPQDPIVIKSPSSVTAPVVTRSGGSRSTLNCSPGEWSPDYAGGFVYQAPQSLSYQWARNGVPIAGAVGTSLNTTSAAEYSCTVTATNPIGAAASAGNAIKVKAAKFKLIVKTKKAKAKVGKLATFRFQALNQGDLKSKSSRICVKLTKAQKKVLKQPKCKKFGKVAGGKRKTVKVQVKVKSGAAGTYKLKLVPKGTGGKAAQAKLQILG